MSERTRGESGPIDPALFRQGMRRLAAGVSIVSTLDGAQPYGMAATSVCSVSADPPALLVCVNRATTSHGLIGASGVFCVNLLADGDDAVARRFSDPSVRAHRFRDREWRALATGAPALVGGLASFDCTVLDALDVHSHTIFVGRVEAIELWRDEVQPLVYLDGGFTALDGRSSRKGAVA